MRQVFQIFFKADGTRPFLVLLCLLVGGTLEAVGIGTLLPALGTLLNTSGQTPSSFERFLRMVLDVFHLTPDFQTLLLLAVGLLSLRAFLLFGAMTYAGITGAKVANNLRRRLIKAIFEARWSYYSDQSSGRIASVISNDATRAGDAYNLAAIAATNFIQIIAYVSIAMMINWRVALLAMAGGLVIAAAAHNLLKISRKTSFKQSDRTALLTSDMVDLVQNIKSLKAMHRYDPMIEGLSALVKRLRRALYVQLLTRFGLSYGNRPADGADPRRISMVCGRGCWHSHSGADCHRHPLPAGHFLHFEVPEAGAKRHPGRGFLRPHPGNDPRS